MSGSMAAQTQVANDEVIGLIPAGGLGTRIGPLPCSKELFPIGLRRAPEQPGFRPKVVCHYLLENMRRAGVTRAYIVLRDGKWDIPAYFKNGAVVDMHISYLVLSLPFGTPFTLDEAYPFVRQSVVAFGFPDMIFQPADAFAQLLVQQNSSDSSVLLGLFPTMAPEKVDMVEIDSNGRVLSIHFKPAVTEHRYTWGIALWRPLFTDFMHEYVNQRRASAATQPELSVGNVFQAAIEAGLKVEGLPVSSSPYLDIGTSEGLTLAMKGQPAF
jgi:glucose-1-phosphate thymidylyltransferase